MVVLSTKEAESLIDALNSAASELEGWAFREFDDEARAEASNLENWVKKLSSRLKKEG